MPFQKSIVFIPNNGDRIDKILPCDWTYTMANEQRNIVFVHQFEASFVSTTPFWRHRTSFETFETI